MHCVTILYPAKEGGTFDFDYYTEKHVPLVAGHIGANAVKAEVRKGVASVDGSAPPFVCLANIWINSVEEFNATLAKHGEEVLGDIPNFTNIQPILQVDEVVA